MKRRRARNFRNAVPVYLRRKNNNNRDTKKVTKENKDDDKWWNTLFNLQHDLKFCPKRCATLCTNLYTFVYAHVSIGEGLPGVANSARLPNCFEAFSCHLGSGPPPSSLSSSPSTRGSTPPDPSQVIHSVPECLIFRTGVGVWELGVSWLPKCHSTYKLWLIHLLPVCWMSLLRVALIFASSKRGV